MRNPDEVLRELGQLYEFQREISKFRFRQPPPDAKTAKPKRKRGPSPDAPPPATTK